MPIADRREAPVTDGELRGMILTKFYEKRKTIIEVDAEGKFVPVCTRNVFLKVYSCNPENFNSWTEDDKSDYISSMKKELAKFFNLEEE